MTPVDLVPLTVAVPLAAAALMLAGSHFIPRVAPDIIAIATALAVAGVCAVLAVYAEAHGPIAYWFGGWRPGPHVVLGVGFGVDAESAAVASFTAFLFAATFMFAWAYFDDVHAHFHVLMLLFLAAMTGFALTRDLFNLFVWFEVMSVAAFGLTAYQLEAPSLTGALHFTVTNSLAAFMMLAGIGLIYARTGFLDFQAMGQVVAGVGHDPLVNGAFCLVVTGLLIKGAILPFHFWLSDAHAVAPSPVSVILSGAMVPVAVFVVAKLCLQVFVASPDARALIDGLLVGLGCATAIVGGLMTWSQRHLKRMLAFSTIAHMGVMVIALTALSAVGIGGVVSIFVGHGLVKAALFMVVGVLLAKRSSLDELSLKGCGRGLAPAGVLMGLAGLFLAGAPWGLLDRGSSLALAAARPAAGWWADAALVFASTLTGGAVLRAAGRIFLDLGPDPGEEASSPTQKDQEKSRRPLWLMLAPCALLLAAAFAPADPIMAGLSRALAGFAGPLARFPSAPQLPHGSPVFGSLCVLVAVGVTGFDLFREKLPRPLTELLGGGLKPVFKGLKLVHSGLVTDYVVWIMVGLASFALCLVL